MEFSDLSVGAATEDANGISFGQLQPATATITNAGTLRIVSKASSEVLFTCSTKPGLAWQCTATTLLLKPTDHEGNGMQLVALRCPDDAAAAKLLAVLNSTSVSIPSGNVFDQKTDKGSSELYFHYYGMLQHQQNMLQDYHRTGTYYAAILENRADFEGKAVMDVGAGSGILSLFSAQVRWLPLLAAALQLLLSPRGNEGEPVHIVHECNGGVHEGGCGVCRLRIMHCALLHCALCIVRCAASGQPGVAAGGARLKVCGVVVQAGARKVYAVEASNMAHFAKKLAESNSSYGHVLEVLQVRRPHPLTPP
jgi:hypothetical protein